MKRWKIILVAAMAISLAGCVLSGKPKASPATPAPPQPASSPAPREPLSVPQTQAVIPPPQLFDPDALNTNPPEKLPEVGLPQGPPKPPAPRTTTTTQPKPPETPPAPVVEPARPPIHEILTQEEQNRHATAQGHKAEVRSLLLKIQRRRLNKAEQDLCVNITQYLTQSDQAVKSGDLRAADELVEKAYILVRGLEGGK